MDMGTTAALDDDEPSTKPDRTTNISMLVDVYKHHWDIFLKGFAFYLGSCAVFATFSPKAGAGDPWMVSSFPGTAIFVASVVALLCLATSIGFMKQIGERIDKVCDKEGFEKIPFWGPQKILAIFKFLTVVIGVVGALHAAYSYRHAMAPQAGDSEHEQPVQTPTG